jgi:cobalamin biosynthetic protein CobC
VLEHGGRLRIAARRYGIPLTDWLDLSTGINPDGYPVPPLPSAAWTRLPEDDDDLAAAAARYYGSHALLPVAGSQAAIQTLPTLIAGARVTVLAPTYAEHPHAWRARRVHACTGADIEAALAATDVLVLANPNNPTGECFAPEQLLDWHRRLAARGGWLIVDEAFIDLTPQLSLTPYVGRPHLVVLRSLGKFFGLAGARVGFVFAEAALRHALAEHLGPWTISGPARHVARTALADGAWQAATRARLARDGERLATLLRANGVGEPCGAGLFQWVVTARAAQLGDALARQGILVRRFDDPASLRFGLPGSEHAWQRLADALAALAPDIAAESTRE